MPTIRGKQTSFIDVDVSDRDLDEIVIKRLHELIGLPAPHRYDCHYIKDGKLIKSEEEGGGSHSWIEESVVRNATPLDISVFDVLYAIKQKQREHRS